MTQTVRKAVLPVAGLGTRVLPGAKTTPKNMLNVVDRPILSYVVEEARAAGIEHFVFIVGRLRGSAHLQPLVACEVRKADVAGRRRIHLGEEQARGQR